MDPLTGTDQIIEGAFAYYDGTISTAAVGFFFYDCDYDVHDSNSTKT